MIVFIEPIKGIREIADRVEVEIINYKLNAPQQSVCFTLQSNFNKMIEQGNLIIPEPIVAQWGVDDSVIETWVLDTLGLIKREVEVSENDLINTHP
jgi:hypothetical protein